jgi:hypothetical protein
MRYSALAYLVILAGCTTDNSLAPPGGDGGVQPIVDLAGVDQAGLDLSAIPPMDLAGLDLTVIPDLTKLASAIGGECFLDSDCTDGKTPTCFKQSLLNKNGYPQTIDGYCSSPCATDQDCGNNADCIGFGTDGKWCLQKCTKPADCRAPGFACFLFNGGNCYPSDSLDCDPTAGDGTCMTQGKQAGGCLRSAIGPGKTGSCRTACDIGTGTCTGGMNAHCVFEDATFDTVTGLPTGDVFKGGICAGDQPSVALGASCLMMNNFYYPYECVDGAECYFFVPNIAKNGDYLCYELCYLAGGGPTDGGIVIPNGGKLAGPCPNGKTCKDVYGEMNEKDPSRRVGYCQ